MALFFDTYKVYIGDTDAGGILYHANHLSFFEHCRRDWLTSLGFDSYFFDDGSHFVVSRAVIEYKAALFLDDNILVSIENIQQQKASLVLTQHIYQDANAMAQNIAAAVGEITLVCVKKSGDTLKPCPPPKALLAKIPSNQTKNTQA